MKSGWDKFVDPPASKSQRRCLYRLGLSRHFVHRHVKTKEQAAKVIADLLEIQARLRQENDVDADLVGAVE